MLSSISSALLDWSVNCEENSVFTVFIIVNAWGEIFINCPNFLFGTKVNKTFDYVDNHSLLNYNELILLQLFLI